MLMDTRPASIARVQYTINIFYPKQPAVNYYYYVTKTALLTEPYPIALGKAKTSKPRQRRAITVSLPRNSIIFTRYGSNIFHMLFSSVTWK